MIVDFILSKDPATEHGGDVAMSKLVMSLARHSCTVRGIALSRTPALRGDEITRVLKPSLDKIALVFGSLRTGRSLIHSRFDTKEIADLIATSSADRFVAEHSYMAEPFLSARPGDASRRLLINSHVSEADVWKETRPTILRLEHRRIERDETRVAIQARSVAYFDKEESQRSVSSKSHWLNLTLPPKAPTDRAATKPVLVFLGDRRWPPNEEAAKRAVKLWPEISNGISGARLLLIGKQASGSRRHTLPSGVEDLKFVEDLDGLLSNARALIAPVRAGGGVRVKILEAASIGLPVVGTHAALGSLGSVLPLTEYDNDKSLIAAARALLLDGYLARECGDSLFEVNAERWKQGAPHSNIQDWLQGK
ncbi:glycosyltransferase [bacterium RCC_150]